MERLGKVLEKEEKKVRQIVVDRLKILHYLGLLEEDKIEVQEVE